MKEHELLARSVSIPAIQLMDRFLALPNRVGVGGSRLCAGIRQIREQCKAQIFIGIGQMPKFQPFDKLIGSLGAGQHGRHHNDGLARWGNAL